MASIYVAGVYVTIDNVDVFIPGVSIGIIVRSDSTDEFISTINADKLISEDYSELFIYPNITNKIATNVKTDVIALLAA